MGQTLISRKLSIVNYDCKMSINEKVSNGHWKLSKISLLNPNPWCQFHQHCMIRLFCLKVLCTAFLSYCLCLYFFGKSKFAKKAVCKILVKLSILCSLLVFLDRNILNCIRIVYKIASTLLWFPILIMIHDKLELNLNSSPTSL